jgi:uncharacterized SAM-binding protein YcdF (DUF218 family)
MDAIYILGGGQRSLANKYKVAAELFQKGVCKRIWIMSRTGITEYSPSLRRNLTNNEWSMRKLGQLGVYRENIEVLKIEEGCFGTFSEAGDVSALIKKRSYKAVILITSRDHTLRTKISFDNFLKNENVSAYVQSSGEKLLLRHLIVEWVKLKVYQYFLIENQ